MRNRAYCFLRFEYLAGLMVLLFCVPCFSKPPAINVLELNRAYAQNNQESLPVVSLMKWGTPLFVLYSDGRLVAGDQNSRRPRFTQLSEYEMADVMSKISTVEGLWSISADYNLTPNTSDQPLHVLTLRIPGKIQKSVSVYGNLDNPSPTDPRPPKAFMSVLDLIAKLTPPKMKPWDPGYIEVYWGDYSYAPDQRRKVSHGKETRLRRVSHRRHVGFSRD